jgi:PhzF family phenazine biosynthesis protein
VIVPITQVDAFTAAPFGGNPAAVCLIDDSAQESWMRLVARETGMPATTFVRAEPSGGYHLRWFTATAELELCGHGTLASAHVLYERGLVQSDRPACFTTRGGSLAATRCNGWIELDFPSIPDEVAPVPDDLAEALGVDLQYVGRGRLDYIVEVASEEVVRNLMPDLVRLRGIRTRGVIVTSRSSSGEYDFVSRFFAPATGIDEDAVTGSAHCCLAPFWSRRLGRNSFVARQLSARGGVVRVALDGARVRLAGQAVTVLRGELVGG